MPKNPDLPYVLARVWAGIAASDAELLAGYERAWEDGASRAGKRLKCRRGCIPCCMGPFEITPLDALRLVSGAEELRESRPALWSMIRRRAIRLDRSMAAAATGAPVPGGLPADQGPRLELLEAFSAQPCPALSRRSGRCLVYRWRPLSCRSYGLPLACGEELLPPCSMNLEAVAPVRWCRFAIEPDPEDREGELLARIQLLAPGTPDTTVAGALASVPAASQEAQS